MSHKYSAPSRQGIDGRKSGQCFVIIDGVRVPWTRPNHARKGYSKGKVTRP